MPQIPQIPYLSVSMHADPDMPIPKGGRDTIPFMEGLGYLSCWLIYSTAAIK
jgi:hypothetical protein